MKKMFLFAFIVMVPLFSASALDSFVRGALKQGLQDYFVNYYAHVEQGWTQDDYPLYGVHHQLEELNIYSTKVLSSSSDLLSVEFNGYAATFDTDFGDLVDEYRFHCFAVLESQLLEWRVCSIVCDLTY